MANEYRVDSIGVEAWVSFDGEVRLDSVGVEAWVATVPTEIRLDAIGVEVWRTIDDKILPRRKQPLIGTF